VPELSDVPASETGRGRNIGKTVGIGIVGDTALTFRLASLECGTGRTPIREDAEGNCNGRQLPHPSAEWPLLGTPGNPSFMGVGVVRAEREVAGGSRDRGRNLVRTMVLQARPGRGKMREVIPAIASKEYK